MVQQEQRKQAAGTLLTCGENVSRGSPPPFTWGFRCTPLAGPLPCLRPGASAKLRVSMKQRQRPEGVRLELTEAVQLELEKLQSQAGLQPAVNPPEGGHKTGSRAPGSHPCCCLAHGLTHPICK